MSLGPWVGGVCADAFGYRATFITGGAILFAGGLLVLVGARERFTRPSAEALKSTGRMGSLFACSGFGTMMAVFLLFNFSVNVAIPILPLFIETFGVAAARIASTTGLLIALSGAAGAVSAAGIGYLGDRIGHKRLLILALILTGILWLAHGVAQSVPQLMVIRILYGLAAGGILPTMNALVGRLTPRECYGKSYGLTASMTSLGMTLGPLAGGFMASYLGYRWPMVFVAFVLIAVVFPVVSRISSR
jgi:MFS transporter, DHA1 family, multidrug resistance protein